MDQTISRPAHPAADFNRALRCSGTAESLESLLLAAESGCLRAQFLAGLAYQTGRGVEVNYTLAAHWYRMAAGSGDSHAIANLGVMSLLGQGAPSDDAEAYTWIQSAVGLGHEWLRPVLALLEQRIATGAVVPEAEATFAAVRPEAPVLSPCTQPGCDPSRCNVS